MRFFAFLILSFCVIATIANSPVCYARDISFSWTANAEQIDGYNLYILAGSAGGITKNNATEIIALDQTTSYTCQGLDDNQTYHFALTAFRNIDNLESDFSVEITLLPVDVSSPDSGLIQDPTADTIDFTQLETVGYSSQDIKGTVTVEDSGATLALSGNRWVKTVQYYNITPETVIEFDFNSSIEAEHHGIGFDEDDQLTNNKRIIQFFGTSMWNHAIQIDQRYLRSDMGDWVHFVIPVGQYYTGDNMNLVFVNDHDAAPQNGNGWFRNIKVHEGGGAPPAPPSSIVTTDIDFNQLETVGYSSQDVKGTVTVEDNGATLALSGNRWVKTAQYYNITPETVIEFDFNSAVEAEHHGIGFDEDDTLTNNKRIIQFFGMAIWQHAIQLDQPYLRSNMGDWVHFVIPVGQYYTGNNMNLVFVNDHDAAPQNGTGRFRNVKVHEGGGGQPVPPDTASTDIDFNQLETVGYSSQDIKGTVTVEDNGATLALSGNRWVKTIQDYNITPETVIEFDFNSSIEAEHHGIGFDEDDALTNNKRIVQFFGTAIWQHAIQIDQPYLRSDMGDWVHFVIPVGQYYTGNNMNLVFVNDHDASPQNGTGRFRNVKVHE